MKGTFVEGATVENVDCSLTIPMQTADMCGFRTSPAAKSSYFDLKNSGDV